MSRKIFKLFFDYNKEESWLNELGAQGFKLLDYKNSCYYFEKEEQGYQYKIDLPTNPWKSRFNQQERQEFLDFLQDLGLDLVAQSQGKAYLRRLAKEDDFKIYIDLPSRMQQLKPIYYTHLLFTFSPLPLAFISFFKGVQFLGYNGVASAVMFGTASYLTFLAFFFGRFAWAYKQRIAQLKKNSFE